MKTPQLFSGALILALGAAVACNRTETNEQARNAAGEVRTAAARAGETIADGWLTTKIQAQYFADEDIKARYINVSAHDRVVTLSGYVESDATRQQAVQIARNTDGVRDVTDKLLIGRAPSDEFPARAPEPAPVATGGTSPGSAAENAAEAAVERLDDARITSTIQAKFFLDSGVKGRNIDVDTGNGVVTLRGEVASEAERAQALLLARNTTGVTRVEDVLTVNAALDQERPGTATREPSDTDTRESRPAAGQRIEDSAVAAALEAKFVADPQVKASQIGVSVRNGVATLQGTVPNQAAEQRALALARETDGVSQVVDRLTVRR